MSVTRAPACALYRPRSETSCLATDIGELTAVTTQAVDLITTTEVLRRVGVARGSNDPIPRATFARWRALGRFPVPVAHVNTSPLWNAVHVDSWIAQNIDEARKRVRRIPRSQQARLQLITGNESGAWLAIAEQPAEQGGA